MKDKNLEIGREALLSLVARMTMTLSGFVGIVIFSRALGANGLGVYYFSYAVSQALGTVSSGIGNALRKRISEVDAEPGVFISVGLVAHFAIVCVVALAVTVAWPVWRPLFESSEALIGAVLMFAALGFFLVGQNICSGAGHPGVASWFDTVRSFLTLALQLGLLWMGAGAFGLMVGLAAASSLTAVASIAYIRVWPRLPTRSSLRSVATFARWSVPNQIVSQLYGRLDAIVLGVFVGKTAVGFYEAANRLVMPAVFVAGSIAAPLAVKTSFKTSMGEDATQDLLNAMSYAGLLALPALFGAVALAQPLLSIIYRPEFAAAWPLLIGMGVYQVLNSYRKPVQAAFEGRDQPEVVFRTLGAALVLNVPLALLLVFRYGAIGVVAATVVSEVTRLLLLQYAVRRRGGGRIFPKPILSQLGSAAVMYGVLRLVLNSVNVGWWWPLVVVVSLGAVTYFTTLFAVSPHFRETLVAVLPIPDTVATRL